MANTRPLVAGPASGPESPFPLQMEGKVIKGFGRGSKEVSRGRFGLCALLSRIAPFLPNDDLRRVRSLRPILRRMSVLALQGDG